MSVHHLDRLEDKKSSQEPEGIWALAGLWSGLLTERGVDDCLKAVYEERERDKGQPIDLSHLVDD